MAATMKTLLLLLVLMILTAMTRAFSIAFLSSRTRSSCLLTTRFMSRKAGVASPEELEAFCAEAGNKLLVVDVRNPDASV